MIKIYKQKKGYTLIEALVYIAVFVMISFIVVSLLLSIFETSRHTVPLSSINRGAVSSLEIMTRRIREAKSVDTINSLLGTTNGSLWLNSLDKNGNPETAKFYLESGVIKVSENGVYLGPISPSEVNVGALIFNLATSTNQSLVKIEIGLSAGSGDYKITEKYYSSVRLRVDN